MFSSAWTIAHVFGIPIRIHFTLLVMLPLLGWVFGGNIDMFAEMMGLESENFLFSSYVLGLLIGFGLFASVALHEIGHTWVALRRGLKIRSITLMILGGVAEMEDLGSDPGDELRIAIMGPLVSIVLGVGLLALGTLPARMLPDIRLFALYLGQINIVLAVFNLLPAFPSDGGRVLRALLAKKSGPLRATKTATTIGQSFAIALAIFGVLSGNIFMVLIAFFLYISAGQEYQTSLLSATLSGLSVGDLMTKDVVTVSAYFSVSQLLALMYDEKHTGYPVVKDGVVVGCVTMEDVRKVVVAQRDVYKVEDIMSETLQTIGPDDDAFEALTRLSRESIGRLFVFQGSTLLGIITRSDILKGFQLRQIEKTMDKQR